jgi:hypothetical protein
MQSRRWSGKGSGMSAIMTDFTLITPYLAGAKFDENMEIGYNARAEVRYRNDVLVDMCRDKRVLHIGCCDHAPLIDKKLKRRDWLHGLVTECSKFTVGVDIDRVAVREASRISGLDNMFAGDITSADKLDAISSRTFDIALFGEVVEHIPNPVSFLTRFAQNYGDVVDKIVVTVPNAFRGGNIKGIFKSVEIINSDHRFFFTPYTIAKVAFDAGFVPEEIKMATFKRAGVLKTMLLNRVPLLAEDIIFIGSLAGRKPAECRL